MSENSEVINQERLKEYHSKRETWLSYFDDDDHHAIWKQIWDLLWRDHIFRVVNEARKIASENADGSVGFNGPVMDLFDVGFVTVQVTAIRRLTDPDDPKRPERNVISLRRILSEMKDQRHLITREAYVSHNGLPYDYLAVHDKWLQERLQKGRNSVGTIPNEGSEAWLTSKIAHEEFDKLSGAQSDKRRRDDLIEERIFENLSEILDECGPIRNHVNKFVAHAADPFSRQALSRENYSVSLAKLDNCYKAIYQVAYGIYGSLLWKGSMSGLPVPQYDHLENLDKPWMSSANLDRLRGLWHKREQEVSEWLKDCEVTQ